MIVKLLYRSVPGIAAALLTAYIFCPLARLERGGNAIGGEWLLVGIAFWAGIWLTDKRHKDER